MFERREAVMTPIQCLLIFSEPKTGKTEALLNLEDNLVLDLQGAASRYGGVFLDYTEPAQNYADKHGCSFEEGMMHYHMHVIDKLEARYKAKKKFKYISIDTIKQFELIASAALDVREKKKEVVLNAGYGKGIAMHRKVMDGMITDLKKYCETLIITGHVRVGSVKIDDVDLDATSIDLEFGSKSTANWLAGSVATDIGFIYRDSANNMRNTITFAKSGTSIVGATAPWLANATFTFSDYSGGRKRYNWKRIFNLNG